MCICGDGGIKKHTHDTQVHTILEKKGKEYDVTRNTGEFLRNRKSWSYTGNEKYQPKHAQGRALRKTILSRIKLSVNKPHSRKRYWAHPKDNYSLTIF